MVRPERIAVRRSRRQQEKGERKKEKGEKENTHGGAVAFGRRQMVGKDPEYKQRMDPFCCLYPGSFTTTAARSAAPPYSSSPLLPFLFAVFARALADDRPVQARHGPRRQLGARICERCRDCTGSCPGIWGLCRLVCCGVRTEVHSIGYAGRATPAFEISSPTLRASSSPGNR
jgi:hypothetical protein